MGTIRCTLRELAKGLKVPLDERTRIIVGPDAAVATLLGRVFDPGRTFPLPRGMRALSDVFGVAVGLDAKQALVVGHVNADDEDAETLSQERAAVMAAWLKGDPAPWLERYGDSTPETKRWGVREDRLMLRALPDLPRMNAKLSAASPNQRQVTPRDPLVEQYQRARDLEVDGIAGPITRERLIKDYFLLTRSAQRRDANGDQESAETSGEPTPLPFNVGSHGAGANFSLAQVEAARSGAEEAAAEGAPSEPSSAQPASSGASEPPQNPNARVDFFFIMAEAGLEPQPGSADGPEYLEWIDLARLHREFRAGDQGDSTTQLALRLFDKTGRTRHANRAYVIMGPEEFSGFTDESGSLGHDDVPPGDYTLKLTLEFFEGADKIVDEVTSPLVVLAGDRDPQVRMLGAVPRCVLARLIGLLFDTNKAFLLPSAIGELKKIRGIYEENDPGELLVVGHTDTTGDASINDPLSLERAKSTLAYLQDDVETWLSFYEESVPQSRRWGAVEDEHMIRAMPNFDEAAAGDDPVLWFQKTRLLEEDGVAGSETRTQLIREYMLLDGAELDSGEFQIKAFAHGCGENFPVDDSGTELDAAPQDRKEDALDRRVELFFFEPEFGVVPKPAGENSKPGSPQYPAWRKLAELTHESTFGPAGQSILHYTLLSNSGSVPLQNVPYVLHMGDATRRGKTDQSGTFLETNLAPGDYVLQINAVEQVLPTLPKDTPAVRAELRRYFLLDEASLTA